MRKVFWKKSSGTGTRKQFECWLLQWNHDVSETGYEIRQFLCYYVLFFVSFVRWPLPCTKHKRYWNATEQLNELTRKTKQCGRSRFVQHKMQHCSLPLKFVKLPNQLVPTTMPTRDVDEQLTSRNSWAHTFNIKQNSFVRSLWNVLRFPTR